MGLRMAGDAAFIVQGGDLINGPGGLDRLRDTCWSTDYQEMRLISIDAPQLHRVPESRAAIVKWLEPLLARNPNRWTVLALHFPLYSLEPQRDNDRVRDALNPLIDKYKVDLVLQGHDHGYGRGTISPNGPGNPGKGATYVVAVVRAGRWRLSHASHRP